MSHPSERDLINYARDELGRYKKFRIIEHCKECSECADKLIEAAREHGPEPEPFKLSKWNKISIAVMVIALVLVVVGMWWMLRSIGESSALPFEPPVEGAPTSPEGEVPQEGAPPDEDEAARLG